MQPPQWGGRDRIPLGWLGEEPCMAHFLSPHHAKRIAAYGRGLKELRLLTPHDFAVLDTMLWTMRKPGEVTLEPSYADIARKSGVKRDTAISAVKKLVQFGHLTKTKQWL